MQDLCKAAVEDVQLLLNVVWEVTAYCYRKCISIENEDFYEAVVELTTSMLFQANCGAVFNLIKALYVA